jgi:hypothetical protein
MAATPAGDRPNVPAGLFSLDANVKRDARNAVLD